MTTEDHRSAGRPGIAVTGGEPRGRPSPMDRLQGLLLGAGQPGAPQPSDRDRGQGTCRWCLTIVTLRSRRTAGWVHLATGHPVCLAPPMGAPLTCTAQPLPPAPRRWDVLFPADHRQARTFWTLGIIGCADPTAPTTRPLNPRAAGPTGPPPIGAAP